MSYVNGSCDLIGDDEKQIFQSKIDTFESFFDTFEDLLDKIL